MAGKTDLKVMTDYFNSGEGKRPTRDWAAEVKALKEGLSAEEYAAFVAAVREVTGD